MINIFTRKKSQAPWTPIILVASASALLIYTLTFTFTNDLSNTIHRVAAICCIALAVAFIVTPLRNSQKQQTIALGVITGCWAAALLVLAHDISGFITPATLCVILLSGKIDDSEAN